MSGFSRILILAVIGILAAVAGAYAERDDSEAGFGLLLTVTNADDPGNGVCNEQCTLREAIDAANTVADSLIQFNVANCGGGVCTITVATALPTITQNGITIDGETQPGFSGAPLIELDGSVVPAMVSGLVVTGNEARIRGLVINDFTAYGIRLDSSNDSIIRGNYIGIDETGTVDDGNHFAGVTMLGGSTSNEIGGDEPGHRNVIAGNDGQGVAVNQDSQNNRILGNYIGTDVTGTVAIGNVYGIQMQDSMGTQIGGSSPGEGNLISGNSGGGVVADFDGNEAGDQGQHRGTERHGWCGAA